MYLFRGYKKAYFVYSDEGLAGECDGTGSLTRSYGYVPGSTWTTDPLFMKEGGDYYFYHNDHLGTPQKITASNGAGVWNANCSSFGEATVDAGCTITNNLRFPGQYFDAETGLHYNWHRYYDSATGRYITADPIGLEGGMNLYLYANANPIMYIDPKGLVCGSGWNDPFVPDNYGFYDWVRLFCDDQNEAYGTW